MAEIDAFLESDDGLGIPVKAEPVLIVDDSKPTRAILRRILETLGLKDIVDVSDARSGFQEIQKRQYAIVLCDVEMDNINGIQFLAAVRSNPDTESLPVILITASRNDRHVASAKRFSANHFLLKPFSPLGLRSAMIEALSQHPTKEVNHTKEGYSAKTTIYKA